MFRITIDNEEVLCDKDITIKEEMLNTPSVILNNVFPKSWEATKDYTTNFYHPDDYSKCIIADEDYIEQSDGTTVEGSNLSITYDDRRNFEYNLKGDTYQYTTTGKNLLTNTNGTTQTINGLTFTKNSDGTVKVNGTSTANTNYYIDGNENNWTTATSGTYYLSDSTPSPTSTTYFLFMDARHLDDSAWDEKYLQTSGQKTRTISDGFKFRGRIVVRSGITMNNIVFKPMLEKSSTATSYEPYTNGASPNPDYPQNIEVVTGEQDIQVCEKNFANYNLLFGNTSYYTINGDNITVLQTDGRAWTTDLDGTTWGIFLKAGQYVFSYKANSSGQIQIWGKNSGQLQRVVLTTGYVAVNLTQDDIVGCKFLNISSFPYDAGKVQIEKGTQASTFEAYKGNTYEINLGKNLVKSVLVNSATTIYTDTLFVEADLQPSTTYTISFNGTNGNQIYANENLFTTGPYINITNNRTVITLTTKDTISKDTASQYNSSYKKWRIFKNGRVEPNPNVYDDLQIEKGSVSTSYSPYKTPIELCDQDYINRSSGKNLFDKDSIVSGYLNENGTIGANSSLSTTDFIKVKPNTYYRINNMEGSHRGKFYNSSKERLSDTFDFNFGANNIIQTSSDTEYIRFTFTNTLANVLQVVEGQDLLPYEPYGTGWYVCKNIGKVVLNGSESWSGSSTNGFYTRIDTLLRTNDYKQKMLSNNFIVATNHTSQTFISNTITGYGGSGYTGQNWVYLKVEGITSTSDLKTWLSTHNTTVYYVLNTPTYIEIVDEELVSQLESVRLLSGLNNISVSSPYRPAIMNLHYNFNDAYYYTNDLYFCGVVKNSGNISLNPREPHFQTLQILDFKTFLSEGETLDRVIVNKTILETIQEVVGVISGYGFVLGNVQIANPDDIIGAYSTENKTAYDIFNYIAEITQSKWTTRLVDENTVAIDFYDPSALPQGTPIEYNTTYFKNNQIDNMFYSYSANDYRNKQIMTSKEVFANISTKETIISSGYGSNFLLEQPVGQVESITLNNVEMSFATKQDKELGYSADFYYSVGSESIESDINIPLGSAIVVQYIPIVAGRQVIANDSEISRISGATGRNGIITRYENRNDASTSNELQMIGQSYIKYKGSPEIKLTVETRSNLWKIGDRVQFNAPIPELATEYMVKSKQIEYIKTIDDVFYTFEMSSSFNSEQDINYFDNQRAKALGNIKEGSYISRNIDIENVANIVFQNATLEKINSTGDNKLNSTLNSPLVQ